MWREERLSQAPFTLQLSELLPSCCQSHISCFWMNFNFFFFSFFPELKIFNTYRHPTPQDHKKYQHLCVQLHNKTKSISHAPWRSKHRIQWAETGQHIVKESLFLLFLAGQASVIRQMASRYICQQSTGASGFLTYRKFVTPGSVSSLESSASFGFSPIH